ncbi:hypothetical protein Btru_064808 [Bulinus truncatus]|nr:hypothetical protein Btru_064808 [Bulinus truncatus]
MGGGGCCSIRPIKELQSEEEKKKTFFLKMDDFPNLDKDEDFKQVLRDLLHSRMAKNVMENGAFLSGPIRLEYMTTAPSDNRTPAPVPRVTSRTSPIHSILPGTSSARRNNSGPSRTRGQMSGLPPMNRNRPGDHNRRVSPFINLFSPPPIGRKIPKSRNRRIKHGPSLKCRPNGIKERTIRNPKLMQGLSLTNIMEPGTSRERRIKQGPSVSRKTKQGPSIRRKTKRRPSLTGSITNQVTPLNSRNKRVPSSSQMVDIGTPRNRRVKPARGPSRRYNRRASPAGRIKSGPLSRRRVKQLPPQARRIEQWKSLFLRVKQELSLRRVERGESRASTTWPNELPPLPTYSELYPPEWRPQGKEQIPPIPNQSQSTDLPMRNQNESAQRETSAQPRRIGEDKDLTDASLSGASGSDVSNTHDEMSSPITSRNGVNYEPPWVPAQGTSRNSENCETQGLPTPKATGGRNENNSPVDESPAPRQTRRRRQRRQPETPSYRDRSELLRSESPRLTEMECPICLGPFGSMGTQFLGCAHGFHEYCLNKWLKRDRSCPVCRAPVDA